LDAGPQILGISSLAAGFNFIVTILNLRAPGLKLNAPAGLHMDDARHAVPDHHRVPGDHVGLVFLMFDRFFGRTFMSPRPARRRCCGSTCSGCFGHPEVYILILPAMGIVSKCYPRSLRKPLFGYTVVVYSGVLIGFMGWGVWSHTCFSVGLGPIADSVFSATTMLIAVPTA